MDKHAERLMTREELRALIKAGEPVSFVADQGSGSVLGRVLTQEEVEKGRQQFSEQFYPNFRPRWMPPLPGQKM